MTFHLLNEDALRKSLWTRLENVEMRGRFSLVRSVFNNMTLEQRECVILDNIEHFVQLTLKKTSQKETMNIVTRQHKVPRGFWDYLRAKLPKWVQELPFCKPHFLMLDDVTLVVNNHNYLCPHISGEAIHHVEFLKQGVSTEQ